MTEWRVYGCGSASSNRSLQTSYEFVDGAVRLQVDFGNGAMYQRCRAWGDINRVLDSITHLVITHAHHDHTVELARHIVAWRYTPGYSPGKPVHLYLTERTLRDVKGLLDSSRFEGIFDEIYIPHVMEPERSFTIGHLRITPFRVVHMEGSVGIRIEAEAGLKVTFTSDTRRFDGLSDCVRGQNLLVTESSFFVMDHPMHMRLQQAASLAQEAGAGALLLVHFYPEMETHSDEELITLIAQWYSGPVFISHDGLALTWDDAQKAWLPRMMF